MLFVSLLPHVVSIIREDGSVVEIAPSGTVARCTQTEETVTVVDGIKITRQSFGTVTGLPERCNGTRFIVSRMVATAAVDRDDLLVPGPLVRDSEGVVTGCRGLSVV